jgi:dynamin GTPase
LLDLFFVSKFTVCILQECNLEEILDEEDPPRSSKDSRRSSGTDFGKAPSLVFKITNKVAYKHVLKGNLISVF